MGASDDERLEALIVEYLHRCERGEDASAEALCAEDPALLGPLREKLASLERLGLLDEDEAPGLPDRLGEFRILRRLGAGGMGVVYLAEQESLERQVALKVIGAAGSSATAVERFRREARALARIDDPGVVRVHAFGDFEGSLYIAMDLVPGMGLDERLGQASEGGEPLPIPEVVRIGRDVARALAAVHGAGLVHRDVKPANIRVTPEGRAVLVDFGLARVLEEEGLSLTGDFLGTPHYAAPEQVSPERSELGPATDVHGLGITLYEGLTQRAPFAAATTEAVLQRVLTAEPEPPRRLNPEVSRDLETVVLKAIEKRPADRYPSAAELAGDLEAVLELRAVRARPASAARRARRFVQRHRIATAVAATGLLFLAALLVVREVDARRRADERRAEAAAVLASVRSGIEDYRDRDASAGELTERVSELLQLRTRRYTEPDEDAQLNAREGEVLLLETERELAFAELFEELRRAERLGADAGEVLELRADLDLLQLEEAIAKDQAEVADFYRRRIAALGETAAGRAAEGLRGTLEIVTGGAVADLDLFRYRLQSSLVPGGEPRMVPVPWRGGELPVAAGTEVLEVTQAAGELRAGDLVLEVAGHPVEGTVLLAEACGPAPRHGRLTRVDGLEVRSRFDAEWLGRPRAEGRSLDIAFEVGEHRLSAAEIDQLGMRLAEPLEVASGGGVEALVWQRGASRRIELPPGLGLRRTAAPLFLGDGSRAGRGETIELGLEPGAWLALLTAEGRPPIRLPFVVGSAQRVRLERPLPVDARGPPGFVYVSHGWSLGFWMMERELSCGEYLAFLSDPEVRGRVDHFGGSRLVPRAAVTDGWRVLWPRTEDGMFRLPAGTRPDHAVTGVSYEDAVDYAAWRTARDRGAGGHWTFELPGHVEWHSAGNPLHGNWRYVFGPHFRPKWTHSNFALRQPARAPVASFPVDESPFGAVDMAGGVMEWSAGWFWEEQGWRAFRCGAWPYADPKMFETLFAQGELSTYTSGAVGFRLIARSGRGE